MTLRHDTAQFHAARDLFEGITGIDATRWLLLRQVGLVDEVGDRKVLLYAVELPETVPVRDANFRWVSHEDLGDARKLCALAYAMR